MPPCRQGRRNTLASLKGLQWVSLFVIRSMLKDFGINLGVAIRIDANAAKGIATREGLGKVRHIEANQVWIQDRVARGDLVIEKVNGKENIADILTKHVDAEDIRVHMHRTGQVIAEGRHEIAP